MLWLLWSLPTRQEQRVSHVELLCVYLQNKSDVTILRSYFVGFCGQLVQLWKWLKPPTTLALTGEIDIASTNQLFIYDRV